MLEAVLRIQSITTSFCVHGQFNKQLLSSHIQHDMWGFICPCENNSLKHTRIITHKPDGSLPSLVTFTNRPSPQLPYQLPEGQTHSIAPRRTKGVQDKAGNNTCLPYFHQFSEGKQKHTHNTWLEKEDYIISPQ